MGPALTDGKPGPTGDKPGPTGDRPELRGDKPGPTGDRPELRDGRPEPKGDKPELTGAKVPELDERVPELLGGYCSGLRPSQESQKERKSGAVPCSRV
jgi:hypothetical protein